MEKKAMILSSMLFLMGNTVVMSLIVLTAFLNPTKTVVVSIDQFGEMYADLAVIVFTICAGALGIYHVLRI